MNIRDYYSGQKKRMKNGTNEKKNMIPFIVLAIVLIVFITSIYYRTNYGTYLEYEVVSSVEKSQESSSTYVSYNSQLLKYSRDGATTLNEKLDYIWNGSYEMKDPIVHTCNDYVVIGDRGSRLVQIFNESGVVNSFVVDHPILGVQIASQGVVSVMMEEDNTVYVVLYKSNGSLIATIQKQISESGFPLSMALSKNGTKIVLSFLDVLSGTLKTNVACYNFDEVGRNENNNFVGGNIYEGELISKVEFVTNDVVCFYKESGFVLYPMVRKLGASPIVEIHFDTPIRSIFSSSSYVGFVVDSKTDDYKYEIIVYNLKGDKVLDQGIDFEYSNITIVDSDIVLYNYSECYVLNVSGSVRFQYQFPKGIHGIFPLSKNKFYLVQGDSIEVIQLRGKK